MSLTADSAVTRQGGRQISAEVAASTVIYGGKLIAKDASGYAVQAANTASYVVHGIADARSDNASGANADKDVELWTDTIVELAATSITKAMEGSIMYVVDAETFDDVDPGNTVIAGILMEYISSTKGRIWINPMIGKTATLGAGVTATVAEINKLAGVTAGAVTASKAVVVDANKDIGDFRNLDAVNVDAGVSGTAGTVDVFPATAARGKLQIAVTNQTGDTTVTAQIDAMGQATAVHFPDPGAAAAYVVMTTAALSLAEADVLQNATAGTAVASKALIVDANLDIAAIRHLTITGNLVTGATTLSETDLAKIDGITNGTVAASKAVVADANLDVTGVRHLTITGNLVTGATTLTETELAYLDNLVAGASSASKALVLGASKNTDVLVLPLGGLYIGAGAGTSVTASAAELNLLDGALGSAHIADPAGGGTVDAEARTAINNILNALEMFNILAPV